MKTKKLKFNTTVKAIAVNNTKQKLFYILFSLFLLLSILYIYFVGKTIFNIIERKTAENDVRILTSYIGGLELEYLSLNNKIDLELARQLGFYEPPTISFALRKTLVKK